MKTIEKIIYSSKYLIKDYLDSSYEIGMELMSYRKKTFKLNSKKALKDSINKTNKH